MSLFSNLKRKAEEVASGVWRQVNPLDHGATYSNPNPQPQQQQQPQQQSQPYQQPSQPQYKNPFAVKPIQAPTQPKPVNLTVQRPNLTQPSYGSGIGGLFNHVKDAFDANTPQDQWKRNQQSPSMPNQTYAQQQATKGIDGGSIANNPLQRAGVVAKSFAKPVAQFANQGAMTVGSAVDTGKMLVGQATGNQIAANNASRNINYAHQYMDQQGHGLLGAGTPFKNAQEAQSGNLGTGLKRIGGNTLATMASVYAPGKGGTALLGAETGLKNALLTGAKTATVSGIGSAGGQIQQNDRINPKQLAIDTAIGGALPVAGYGLNKGFNMAKPALNDLTKQAGNVIGKAKTGVGDVFNQAVTPEGVRIPMPKNPVDTSSSKYIVNMPNGGEKSVADTYLTNLSGKKLKNAAKNELLKREGKTVEFPDGSKAVINKNTINEFLYGKRDRPFTNQEYQDFLRSLGNIEEHAQISGKARPAPNLKENPKAISKRGFDYRPVNYEVNGRDRLNEINVAKGDSFDTMYQYTKPVENKNNPPFANIVDKSARRNNVGGYTPNIPQPPQNVNPIKGLQELKDKLKKPPTDINQDGSFKNPFTSLKQQGGLNPKGDINAFTGKPFEGAPKIGGTPVEKTSLHPHQQAVVNQYADMLKSMDDGVKGGQLVNIADETYSGSYRRTSEHSKFYSDYYKQYGRKPSKAAFQEEALRQLQSGKGDEYAVQAFKDAGDPEVQSLFNATDSGAMGKQPVGETFTVPTSPIAPVEKPLTQDLPIQQTTQTSGGLGVAKTSEISNTKLSQPAQSKGVSQTYTKEKLPQDGTKSLQVNNTPIQPVIKVVNPVETKVKTTKSKLVGSDTISPEVNSKLNTDYTAHSFNAQKANAENLVNKDLPTATQDAFSLVDKKPGTMNDPEHQFVLKVAQAQDAIGTKESQQLANTLYDKILEHRTATAQTFAAFRDIANSSPRALGTQAERALKKQGVTLNGAEKKVLNDLIDGVKKTAPGTKERDIALHQLVTWTNSKLPTGIGDKVVNFWRAGLLTSPITTAGNTLGNATELATRNLWTNPIAAGVDRLFSAFTGVRTKTLSGGQIKGAGTGIGKAKTYLQTGFDERNPITKFDGHGETNYGNSMLGKATGKYVNGVYRWMGGQDQPFYYAAKNQAAKELATADAKNLKLKGQAKTDYIDKAIANPSWKPQTFKTKSDAMSAGKYSVYQNETLIGNIAAGAKTRAAQHSQLGGAVANFVLPFTQVPASVAMRIVDRTPVGTAAEIVKQIARKEFDQRAMSESIANGSFGPGVIAAGYALSKSGDITGAYPTDSKEQELWKSENKQANSVKVGGRWLSLNYMQPFGTLLTVGGQLHRDIKNGKSPAEAWTAAAGTAAKSVENQSFLQGLNGVLSAINDPQRSMSKWVNTTASSVVPNAVRTVARATDPMQRDIKNVGDALKGAIPGMRESTPTKQDMFGQNLPAVDTPLNQALNPLRPTVARGNDPLTSELRRLQDTKNGIIPTQFNGTAINGMKLTPEQVRQLQTQVGTNVKEAWTQIIQDPRYQALNDADKNTVLKRASDTINQATKAQFSAQNNGDPANVKLSKAQKDYLANGGGDFLTATVNKNRETVIKSKYSQEVQDFSKSSNAEKSAYFKRDPAKAKQLYDQAKQMDAELGKTTTKKASTGRKASTKKVAKGRVKKAPKVAQTWKSMKAPKPNKVKLTSSGPKVGKLPSLKGTSLKGIKPVKKL